VAVHACMVEVFLSCFSEPEMWCLPTHFFCMYRVDLQNIHVCCTSLINHACCMSYQHPWINGFLFTSKTDYDILQHRFFHHFLFSFNCFLRKLPQSQQILYNFSLRKAFYFFLSRQSVTSFHHVLEVYDL
jgi:hypothetical protein